jgi:tryptophan 2-monooxygenase
MSFLSMPQGYYRIKTEKNKQAFTPKSMIDTLFDYRAFLVENNHKQGSIAIKPPSQNKKVAIIGAGAAGLVAAYELAKVKNIEVTLYEASDRLGGRMDSIRIDDGEFNDKIFEMGCMRFPPTSHTLLSLSGSIWLKTGAKLSRSRCC